MMYELENYNTKERFICNTKVNCIIDISSLVENIACGGSLSLLMDEAFFADYFINLGFRVYRLPYPTKSPFFMYDEINFKEELGLDIESCTGSGVPDFLIVDFNTKKFFFLEVKKDDEAKRKNAENSLHKNQINWQEKNKEKPFYIGRLKPFSYSLKDKNVLKDLKKELKVEVLTKN